MGFVGLLLMFTLSITSLGGSLASSSQLRANARILTGSNVKVCPNDDYTLIFVCNATGMNIEWLFSPFIPNSSPLSIENYDQGESASGDRVIVYITKKTTLRPLIDLTIESQLHISTKSILGEQSSLFQVVCASDNIRDEISITKLVGSFPEIHSASSNEMAVVTVNWSAENVDDIEALQLNIVSNFTEEEIYTTCITDKESREIVVRTTLNPGDYEITLVAFDICGENYDSKTFLLNIPEPQITSVQLQVSTVYLKSTSFCTPVAAPERCPATGSNTGAVAGLSNVLMISAIALGLTLAIWRCSTYI